jgi:phage N-6-adenine-methyltransferase
MIAHAAMFTSNSDLWATSPDFFQKMDRRYGPFDLDVCAVAENAKCPRFYSPEQDGLQQPWTGRCWCNPPYGKTIGRWIAKAWQSSREGATVVCLLPARNDARFCSAACKQAAYRGRAVLRIRGNAAGMDHGHRAL